MSQPQAGGGRRQTSAPALVGALVVTVGVVIAFVVFRGLFSRDFEAEPERVDYLETVYAVQQAGFQAAYPPALPDGWLATNVVFDAGERPSLGLSFLTDDERYVGVQQEDADVDDLLATYVDEDDVDEEETFSSSGPVAGTWQGWSDAGGDHAFSAEVGGDTVLVYGSAPVADLEAVVDSLTQDPAPQP